MKTPISSEAIKQLFTEARSFHSWTKDPIREKDLQALYEIFKWGPTSVNSQPARFISVQSEEAKAKLYPALLGSNVAQVKAAPATLIIAYDENFAEKLDELWPAYPVKQYFTDPKLVYDTAFRNSSFQGAYFMLAARALGFDVGPLSGFDNAIVDEAFFKGTTLKSNFLCMIGHGTSEGLFPRGPRLSFEDAVKII